MALRGEGERKTTPPNEFNTMRYLSWLEEYSFHVKSYKWDVEEINLHLRAAIKNRETLRKIRIYATGALAIAGAGIIASSTLNTPSVNNSAVIISGAALAGTTIFLNIHLRNKARKHVQQANMLRAVR
ncbi:MAG: hypothetical protein QM536_00525 [Chitinophagaceae bacterium]|nr:hypothetical protein [Chitinophagaceae bacterium]